MKRFLKRLALLLGPVALLLALLALALRASGEFCSVPAVAARMAAGENVRFELNYRPHATAELKADTAALRGADVLVVGTSRTMQFSQAMLPKADFYNAGGSVSRLGQVLPFLKSLPAEKRPKVVLLGLDQYFYNDAWDGLTENDPAYTVVRDPVDPVGAFFSFLHHFGDAKIDPGRLLSAGANVLGVPARVRGSGFLTDGSYLYGTQGENQCGDPGFSDALRRVATGTNRFQYGNTVSTAKLAMTEELLSWCADEGIAVVGYLPPYAPSVASAMQKSKNYAYIDQIFPNLLEIFDKFDMECYDFTYMEDTDDEEFVDGFHAGDQIYCRMLLRMLRQDSLLTRYTDADSLNRLLSHARNARTLDYGGVPGNAFQNQEG